MKVRPYDRLRFMVTSEEHSNKEYLCDFSEEQPVCECPWFSIRLKKTGQLCKHLKKCKEFMADQLIEAMKEQEKKRE